MPSIPSKLSLRIDVALIAVVDRVLSLSSTLPKKLVEGTVGVISLRTVSEPLAHVTL